jgi:hypothetical protein
LTARNLIQGEVQDSEARRWCIKRKVEGDDAEDLECLILDEELSQVGRTETLFEFKIERRSGVVNNAEWVACRAHYITSHLI